MLTFRIVWVDFKNASRWQAEGIFKNFFPCKPAPGSEAEKKAQEAAAEPADPKRPDHRRRDTKHLVPLLEAEEIATLAKRFAENIPEDELSVRIYSFVLGVRLFIRVLGCEPSRVFAQEQDSSSRVR